MRGVDSFPSTPEPPTPLARRPMMARAESLASSTASTDDEPDSSFFRSFAHGPSPTTMTDEPTPLALPAASSGGDSYFTVERQQQRKRASRQSISYIASAVPPALAVLSSTPPSASSASPTAPTALPVPKHVVHVLPPATLPHSPPPSQASSFSRGFGPSGRFGDGLLLLLQPTYQSQLAAVAREYALPSLGGLSLFLVLPGDGGKPRLTDEVWPIMFASFLSGTAPDATGFPIAATLELDIDLRRAGRWLEPFLASSTSTPQSTAPVRRPTVLPRLDVDAPVTADPLQQHAAPRRPLSLARSTSGVQDRHVSFSPSTRVLASYQQPKDTPPVSPSLSLPLGKGTMSSAMSPTFKFQQTQQHVFRRSPPPPPFAGNAAPPSVPAPVSARATLPLAIELPSLQAVSASVSAPTGPPHAAPGRRPADLVGRDWSIKMRPIWEISGTPTPDLEPERRNTADSTVGKMQQAQAHAAVRPPTTATGKHYSYPFFKVYRDVYPFSAMTIYPPPAAAHPPLKAIRQLPSTTSATVGRYPFFEVYPSVYPHLRPYPPAAASILRGEDEKAWTLPPASFCYPNVVVYPSTGARPKVPWQLPPVHVCYPHLVIYPAAGGPRKVDWDDWRAAARVTPARGLVYGPKMTIYPPTSTAVDGAPWRNLAMAPPVATLRYPHLVIYPSSRSRVPRYGARPQPLSLNDNRDLGVDSYPSTPLSPDRLPSASLESRLLLSAVSDTFHLVHLDQRDLCPSPIRGHDEPRFFPSYKPSWSDSVAQKQPVARAQARLIGTDWELRRRMKGIKEASELSPRVLPPSTEGEDSDESCSSVPSLEGELARTAGDRKFSIPSSVSLSDVRTPSTASLLDQFPSPVLDNPFADPSELEAPEATAGADHASFTQQALSSPAKSPAGPVTFRLSNGLAAALGLDGTKSPQTPAMPIQLTTTDWDDAGERAGDSVEAVEDGAQYVVVQEEETESVANTSVYSDAADPVLFTFPSLKTSDDLPAAVAQYIIEAQTQSIQRRGRFTVALSGGSMSKLLADGLLQDKRVRWDQWPVFFVDERLVPLDHPDSTFAAYEKELFGKVPIPAWNVHSIKSVPELSAATISSTVAEEIATDYEAQLVSTFPDECNGPGLLPGPPRFDLCLLGLGSDGHTASLFPGQALLDEKDWWVGRVHDSPKPPASRITFTLPVLSAARRLAVICTGAEKTEALNRSLQQACMDINLVESSQGRLPVGMIRLDRHPVVVFVDEECSEGLRYPSSEFWDPESA